MKAFSNKLDLKNTTPYHRLNTEGSPPRQKQNSISPVNMHFNTQQSVRDLNDIEVMQAYQDPKTINTLRQELLDNKKTPLNVNNLF